MTGQLGPSKHCTAPAAAAAQPGLALPTFQTSNQQQQPTCIGYEDVNTSQLLHCLLYQLLHLIFLGDITVRVLCFDALLLQAIYCLLCCTVIYIANHHSSTFIA
jgi:hypothetical protein